MESAAKSAPRLACPPPLHTHPWLEVDIDSITHTPTRLHSPPTQAQRSPSADELLQHHQLKIDKQLQQEEHKMQPAAPLLHLPQPTSSFSSSPTSLLLSHTSLPHSHRPSLAYNESENSVDINSAPPAKAASVRDEEKEEHKQQQPAVAAVVNRRRRAVPHRLQPAASPGPVHALCVDDNVVQLKLASRMLSRLGYVPHTLRSGEEAVAFLDDVRWGPEPQPAVERWVVLMDLSLEGMDGMTATRQLRAHGHTMPILALTAAVMARDRGQAMDSGMDGFVCKPATDEVLDRALMAALKKRN